MRQHLILIATFSLLFFSVAGTSVQAETTSPTDSHTARAALTEGESRLDHTRREEAEGKDVWEKLQNKQTDCDNLSDSDFGALGEYFMGQMVGSSHEAMNNMMVRMMGEEGEEQMHIAMGKRNSGCDTSVAFPQKGVGFMPMMGTGWGNMMGGWGGFGILGWITMLAFWLLLILGVIALIRYLGGSGKRGDEGKSPLDILKERYARGEIDKKEFEEKKKDLR